MQIRTIKKVKHFFKCIIGVWLIYVFINGLIHKGDAHNVIMFFPIPLALFGVVGSVMAIFYRFSNGRYSKILLETKTIFNNFKGIVIFGGALYVEGIYGGRRIKGYLTSKRGKYLGEFCPDFFRFTTVLDGGKFVIFRRINDNVYISGTIMYLDILIREFYAPRDLSALVKAADEYDQRSAITGNG